MSPEHIARDWMRQVSATAAAQDFDAHMDLVSKRIRVVGDPAFAGIDYDNWARQCRHEFDNGLLKSVEYAGFKLEAHSADQIVFKTHETVTGTDGTVNAHGIEVLLEREDDGRWRVTRERILSAEEMQQTVS